MKQMHSMLREPRCPGLAVIAAMGFAVALAFAGGCEEEPIREYRVPKPVDIDPTGGQAGADEGPADRAPRESPATSGLAGPSQAGGEPPLEYSLPEGWRAIEDLGPMRVAAFEVGRGDPPVTVTVIPLGPEAGDLRPNVVRWRRLVGAAPLKPNEQPATRDVRLADGTAAKVVTVTGESEAIIGALAMRGGRPWFFTLRGPRDAALAAGDDFQAFLESVRFDVSGAAAPDEGGDHDHD